MRFYFKYILSRIVIGLVILGLLSLAGCKDNRGEAEDRFQWDQIQRLKKDVGNNEASFQALAKDSRSLREDVDNLAAVAKSNQVLVRTLTDIEAVQSKKEYLYDDIDPNAPINTHLLKVSDSWSKEYGTSHESVLKYNVVAAWAFAQKALKQIVELEKRVAGLDKQVARLKKWVAKLEKRVEALEPVEGTVKIEANGAWYAYSGTDWVKIVDPIIPISIKALEPKIIDPNEVIK